jgi:hypothetical protein
MSKEEEIKEKLGDLIDIMEDLWGELEGFEVRLEHPIVDGERQAFANIKEFSITHLYKTQITI